MARVAYILMIGCSILLSCNPNTVIDSTVDMPNNEWNYAQLAKADYQIKDTTTTYQVNLKLRINSNYRYTNLFVLTYFTTPKAQKILRYQFQLANKEGTWLGKGSGDIYAFKFPLKTNVRYADTGKYSIKIEQNMRDNPLLGVSDVGIEVVKSK